MSIGTVVLDWNSLFYSTSGNFVDELSSVQLDGIERFLGTQEWIKYSWWWWSWSWVLYHLFSTSTSLMLRERVSSYFRLATETGMGIGRSRALKLRRMEVVLCFALDSFPLSLSNPGFWNTKVKLFLLEMSWNRSIEALETNQVFQTRCPHFILFQ